MRELFHNRAVQSLGGWIGVMTPIFGVFGWLTPDWVGKLTWPYLALGGFIAAIISALILSVALAIGAWGYRLMRPYGASSSSTIEAQGQSAGAYDDTKIKEQLSGVSGRFEHYDHKIAELNDVMSKLKKSIEEQSYHVINLSLIERLERWESASFPKYVDAVNTRWAHIERMILDAGHPHGSRAWNDMKEQFAYYLRDLEHEISRETKRDIKLTGTPKFSENQLIRFPGDEAASDEAKRIDYNRLYEMKEGAIQALTSLRNRIISQRQNLKSIHGYLSKEEEMGTGRDFRP